MGRGVAAACPETGTSNLYLVAGLHRMMGGGATAPRPVFGNISLHRVMGGGATAPPPNTREHHCQVLEFLHDKDASGYGQEPCRRLARTQEYQHITERNFLKIYSSWEDV